MARIPRDVVDTVRERTDITQVVSRHVKLTRRGGNFVGLCPFHQEKTPSFNVVPNKGIYHCFGCQEGGDVFAFLMKLEGLSFAEAVRELAQHAGVVIPERELSPQERRALRQKATLYDVLEAACNFYQSTLWTTSDARVARDYLDERGMTQETLKEARVGYAPEGWSNLLDHLHTQGFAPRLAHEAGLAKEGKSGGYYDVFRHRIVFPIRDSRGRVIGFGGRLLEGDGPKYLNSPETRLYEKSKILYGLYTARNAIGRSDRAVVVEGYFDVLSMHQHGFKEAVATCGTSLTRPHLDRIRRLTRNVVMLTDADEAGSRAAERSLPLFLEAGLQAWRVQIPGAKDPDELLKESGADALSTALEHRQPLVEWVVDRKLTGAGGVMGQQAILEELMPILLALPPQSVSQFAARLRINEAALLKTLSEARHKRQPASDTQTNAPPPPRGWRPSRDLVHLFWLLVHRYDHVADLLARVDPSLFEAAVRPSFGRMISGEPVAPIIEAASDPGLKRTLLAVVARETLYTPEQSALGVVQILVRLIRPRMDHHLRRLTQDVEASVADPASLRSALTRRKELKQTQVDLEAALREEDIDRCMLLLTDAARVVVE